MGWWSETIMGGDSPLDYQYDFYKIMGINDDEYFDDKNNFEGTTKDLVEQHLDAMFADADTETFERAIKYQVLAKIILHSGAKISAEQKKILYDECEKDPEMDWNDGGKKRREFIKDLLDKIKGHKEGLVSLLMTESLLVKIFSVFRSDDNKK